MHLTTDFLKVIINVMAGSKQLTANVYLIYFEYLGLVATVIFYILKLIFLIIIPSPLKEICF